MEIIINDQQTIGEIKTAFHSHFPHLKIEFYLVSHQAGEATAKTPRLEDHWQLGQVRTIHNTGNLSINGHQKTKTLELRFKELFGLNIQLFRKSGNIWLQSTTTDDWTLSQQEHHSQEREDLRRALEDQAPEEIENR